MGLKEEYVKFIIKLNYDGWFSLFCGAALVLIMAPFLPMFICALFGLCFPWIIEMAHCFCSTIFFGIKKKQSIKIPIMSLIGSCIGVGVSYLWVMKQITEIVWF